MVLVESGRSGTASATSGANRVVGISEMIVERDSGNTIVTYSLGSCLGVTIYDPIVHVGGLIHCMLPLSKIDPVKAQAMPAMFVDTGIPALLQAALNLGADLGCLKLKVIGAGSPLDDNGVFNIGDRNLAVLRKILWKNNILIAAQETGGSEARTVYLDMKSGDVTIRASGQTRRI